MRSYRIIAVGDRGIGGDQLDKLGARCAEREAGCRLQLGGDAEIARGLNDVLAADHLLQPHSRDIARLGEGLAKRDEAAIGAVAIFRRPSIRSEEHTSELQSLMRLSY